MISRALACLVATTSALANAEPAAKPAGPAEPVEPAVARVRDANLETTERRTSLMVTLAGGPGFTLGFGVADAAGRGGSGSLRLARVMTPSWLVTLELTGTALLHKAALTSRTLINNASGALLGGQYFVGPSFWIRGAVGVGVFALRFEDSMDDRDLIGPAGLGGAGIDLVRFRHVSLGLEGYTLLLLNREGAVSSTAFLLDLSIF